MSTNFMTYKLVKPLARKFCHFCTREITKGEECIKFAGRLDYCGGFTHGYSHLSCDQMTANRLKG